MRAALAFAVFLWTLTAGCGEKAGSQTFRRPPPAAVEIVSVTRQAITDVIGLVGQLEAEESVLMKAETEGIIEAVACEEGQEVERGALLFRLRDDEQRARLEEARAQLTLAQDAFRRAKTLAAQNTVSEAEFDRASADLQAARARRDLARVELERTEIRAPFDGVLGARMVSPGDRVEPDTGLIRIDAVAGLRLAFTVPEIAVPIARVGMLVEISVAPLPGDTFAGEVYFVSPTLDARSRRLLLKARVPNKDRRLRPGLFANVQLEIARHEDTIVIPESAVAYDALGAFVWRVDDKDVATRGGVELGIRRAGQVEVVSGLQAGERVVSAGTHKVVAGGRVREVPPVVAQPGAPAAGDGKGRDG
jgi:membrane fusion protein (multidrug efflux system)